jgi:GxxExxY protein
MAEDLASAVDQLSYAVIGAAIAVHQRMGPGLLESVYHACLTYELTRRGVPHACDVQIPLRYEGALLETRLRLDILVDNAIVLELKSVESLAPIHKSQLLTYLRLTGHRRGLLINFNVLRLTDGVVRMVL